MDLQPLKRLHHRLIRNGRHVERTKDSDRFVPLFEAACTPTGTRCISRFLGGANPRVPANIDRRGISFWFKAPQDYFSSLSFIVGTYARHNDCLLTLRIRDDAGTTVATSKKLASELTDNTWTSFYFDPVYPSKSKWYSVTFESPDATTHSHIALWGEIAPEKKESGWDEDPRGKLTPIPTLSMHSSFEGAQAEHAAAQPHAERRLKDIALSERSCAIVIQEAKLVEQASEVRQLLAWLSSSGVAVQVVTEFGLEECAEKTSELDFLLLLEYPLNQEAEKLIRTAKHKHCPVGFARSAHPAVQPKDNIWFSSLSDTEQRRLSIISNEIRSAEEAADFKIILGPAQEQLPEGSFYLPPLETVTSPETVLSARLTSALQTYRARWLPSFTIIGILYAKEDQIEFFLESLYRQSYQGEFEVILVNDTTPDKSVEVTHEFLERKKREFPNRSHPKVTIIHNEKNLGNCGSRNAALAKATSDLVVIIDADCMLNRHFLREHAEAHASGDTEVVVGAFNIETEGRPPLQVLDWYEARPEEAAERALFQDQINRFSFLNCITRNFSIRRSFIEGKLFDDLFSYSKDPNSGFGWEDVEMGYRLYQRGVRVKYNGRAFSIHVSHPSSVDEKTKPLRSLLNFRRLIDKHPAIEFVSRRWTLETFRKITGWADQNDLPQNEDRLYLESKFSRHDSKLFSPVKNRPIRVLSYRWHCPHQYELYKLPYQFTLAQNLGTLWTDQWNYDQRPLPMNAHFEPWSEINQKDYDLAILHFDENVLSPENCNGVLEPSWGKSFKTLREALRIPAVAICHGTPQFAGQYDINYEGVDLGSMIENERKRLVEFLGDIPVVCNSHQAHVEWQFKNSQIIWHGFDPTEFPLTTYERGIVTMGSSMRERPHYRGWKLFNEIFEGVSETDRPDSLKVEEPDAYYPPGTNSFAQVRFRNYVDAIRKFSIYLNPTIRSPMPRSRGEAMMCGLATVSAKNHDVDLFIENGVNGFYSNDPAELREILVRLSKDKKLTREIGMKGRETAMDTFNHDRYLKKWEELIGSVIS